MSKIKKLAGETVLYGMGTILPRAINFALVRLHTKAFLPEDYGVITILYAYATFINVLYLFGMETAYFRFANKPGADEKRIFNIALTTVIAISVSISLLFILFYKPIGVALNIGAHPEYVIWFVVIMLTDALVAIPFARLRYQKRPIKFAAGKLMNILIIVVLNIYFLTIAFDPSTGVGLVFLANLIANLFYIIFFARELFSWRPAYDAVISRQMFTYAYPVMITGLAGMMNETFSRLTLEAWLPKNFYPGKSAQYATGVLGACFKFGVLMNLATQSFRFAAEPFFFSNAADKNSPQLFARVNHYFIIVCCVILLGVGINMDFLKHFLGKEEYWEGLNIVPFLLLGYLFLGVYYNISAWFKLTDKTYYGTILACLGAVVTLVGNYFLIPVAGILGTAWTAFACYFVMTVGCYALGQKFYPIPYNVLGGFAYILLTFALVYAVNAIIIENEYVAFGVHQLILLAYLLIVYLIERKHFRRATP